MKPFDTAKIDEILRNAVDDIRSRPTPFRLCGDYVYGKDVCIARQGDSPSEYITDRYELESFYKTFDFQRNDSVNDFIQKVKDYVKQKEKEIADKFNGKPFTCHHLCDWLWLEDDDGKILRHGYGKDKNTYSATLVKYAKYLED